MKLFVAMLLIATTYGADATAKDCTTGADKMCGHCMKASGCMICWDGYPKDKICTAPTTKVENCISYSNATTCRQCDKDYILDGTKCEKLSTPKITNCKVESKGICSACTGYDLASDGKKCESTACKLDNCEACGKKNGTTQTCAMCKDGYYLNDKALCVAVPTGMEKCYVSTAGKCASCKPKSFVESFTSDTDFRCSAPSMFFAAILTTVIGLLF